MKYTHMAMGVPMHQVRAEFLTGYVEVANAVGLDAERMLLDAGFPPRALADPENRLPATAAIKLIETSAEMSGEENFGLLMAERRTIGNLGPISLLLERLPNIHEVTRMGAAHRRHYNDITECVLEQGEEISVIRYDFLPNLWGEQTADLVTGISYKALVSISGGKWRPLAVHALRKTPSDRSVWRRVYNSAVEFESTFNGFSCTSASLFAPNPRADPLMVRNAERLLGLVPLDPEVERAAERVRRSISALMPTGQVTLEQVAQHMAMSPRSLQRRLEAEGHPFSELLTAVRKDLSVAYLRNSNRPITTVAYLLGYASPASFTRWFTSVFGVTPQTWRAKPVDVGDGPPPA